MIPTITLLAVVLGLALDAALPGIGHQAANALVVAAFSLVFRLAHREEQRQLLICLVLATAGELLLCFGWGLYEYRFSNLPIFVPPGHALIFLTGCRLAERVPRGTWKLILALAAPAVLLLALSGRDTSGLLLLPVFLLCLLHPTCRNLYGTMLVLAWLVELLGTAVGSWQWSPRMPLLNLTQINPPLLGGVFYCLLDLLVLRCFQVSRAPASPESGSTW